MQASLRSMGPTGLATFIARHGRGPSRELDALCAQKDAHTSLLYWFTDLPSAIAEASRTNRPILSLRLLGRLDEELSCANSRFFRKLLYPEPAINALLRDRFVLHWQSVRPVPKVTIDFGDGRRLVRTLTGNSVHVVLDRDGHPADALPGLFAPHVFAELLARAHRIATAERTRCALMHQQELATPVTATVAGAGVATFDAMAANPAEPRAIRASRIAMTKHRVEAPLLEAVRPIADDSLDHDTRENLGLHARVHQAFASGAMWSSVDAMVARIYEDLFLMPIDDPALGLDVPDPFAA